MLDSLTELKNLINPPTAQIPSEDFEIIVIIDGEQYNYWTEAEITKRFDGISTFSITSPFDPSIKGFRDIFRPGISRDVQIAVDGSIEISGNFVNVKPSSSPTGRTVTVDGYARCGVLNYVNPDPLTWPVYMNGLTLDQIITKLGATFGILGSVKTGDANAVENTSSPFLDSNSVTPKADQKIWDFITKLAKQRHVYLADDFLGNVEIKSYNYLSYVTRIDDSIASIDINYPFNDIPTDVYALGTDFDVAGKKTSIVNPAITGAYKPIIYKASDTPAGGLKKAAIGELGRRMANAMTLTIEYPGWKTPDGALLRAGDVVAVKSPSNMIYKWYDFIVRNVTYKKSGSAQTTTLDCTFWQTFNGEILDAFPWEEPALVPSVSTLLDEIERAVPKL